MTQDVIIGNALSLGAMISESISGTRSKQKEIMAIQVVSQIFYGSAAFFLKGYSAMAQNVVSLFRNLIAMRDSSNKTIENILIAAGVVLGAVVNNRGLLGWLPIIANCGYSIAIFRFKDNEKALRMAFAGSNLMYVAFKLRGSRIQYCRSCNDGDRAHT